MGEGGNRPPLSLGLEHNGSLCHASCSMPLITLVDTSLEGAQPGGPACFVSSEWDLWTDCPARGMTVLGCWLSLGCTYAFMLERSDGGQVSVCACVSAHGDTHVPGAVWTKSASTYTHGSVGFCKLRTGNAAFLSTSGAHLPRPSPVVRVSVSLFPCTRPRRAELAVKPLGGKKY